MQAAMWRVAKVAAGCTVMMITLHDHVGTVARVQGLSMQPTLNPESGDCDYVFLNRFALNSSGPLVSRGDVVSLYSPSNPDRKLVKRVLGVGGDVVIPVKARGDLSAAVEVPPGHVWIEGDHTGHSLDSNAFGPVPEGLVTSRVTHVIWPPERWRRLESRLMMKDWSRLIKPSLLTLEEENACDLDLTEELESCDC